VKFLVIYCCLSLFLFWSPQSHSHFGCPRLRTNERTPPNRTTRDISLFLLPSSVLYYECDITLPRLFGSDKPTPNHYLPSLISSPLLASVLLNITTHYTLLPLSISAPFLLPSPSSDPFATRRGKVGQVTIASPAPRFTPRTYPDFPDSEKTLVFFDF